MELKSNVSVLLLMFLGFAVAGMSPDDYFHPAAQQYINGNDEQAKTTVIEGLQQFPGDPKLIALKGLTKDHKKQNQQNQQQEQNKKNQDKKDQNKQDQNKQDKNQQNQNQKQDQQQKDRKSVV